MQLEVIAAVRHYEQMYATENSSPSSRQLHNLAQSYNRATTDKHREHLAADVAEDITPAEAGTIRRAALAVELGLPGIVCRARATGMEPVEIARQLGATPSYIRRILRDNRTTLAEAVANLNESSRKFGETVEKTRAAVEGVTGGHDWYHPTPTVGLVCRHCNLAHKQWSGEACPTN
ncbi:hypothetical protein [Streptomyces nitrosporeus]|uniref:hypothetical protein n=1 Tax=Streptomyces nitrosporeus TaxID=28894 RepID=UPI0039A3D0EE